MRVVVLGHRGAGKTALVALGLSELRALAVDNAAGNSARMSAIGRWRVHRTCQQLTAGRPIPATRAVKTTTLTLMAGPDRPTLSVAVHDHPGRAVGSGSATHARQLETDLARADGILVVVSREDLAASGGPQLSRCRPLVASVRRAFLANRTARVHRRDPAGRWDEAGAASVVVVVTGAGGGCVAGELAVLTAPFAGLETSASMRVAGATIAAANGPETSHAALPLLLCLDRWVAGTSGPVRAVWQEATSAWFKGAWDAAEVTGRYLWPLSRPSRRAR